VDIEARLKPAANAALKLRATTTEAIRRSYSNPSFLSFGGMVALQKGLDGLLRKKS